MSHDSDGNPVFDVDPASSSGQLVALLEWARRRGFRLGPTIKIGDLVLQVQDLRQVEGRDVPVLDDPGAWGSVGFPEGDK